MARWSVSAVWPSTGPATPKPPTGSCVPRTCSSRRTRRSSCERSVYSAVVNDRTTIGCGRVARGSKSPSSVLVPPTSPARIMLTSILISFIVMPVRPAVDQSERGGRLPSPSPDQSSPTTRRSARRFYRKTQLARPARCARARRASRRRDGRRGQRRTTMLVVGAEGFGPSAEKSNKLRRAEELNAQLADADRDRLGRAVLPAGWCADAGNVEAAVLGDARSARALPVAARGSPALSREVRRHQARRCGPTPTRSSRSPDVAVIKQANDEIDRGRIVSERRARAAGRRARGSWRSISGSTPRRRRS